MKETRRNLKNLNQNSVNFLDNLAKAAYESIVEGYSERLEKLIQKCRVGPSLSTVNDILVTVEPFTGEFSGFKIRY